MNEACMYHERSACRQKCIQIWAPPHRTPNCVYTREPPATLESLTGSSTRIAVQATLEVSRCHQDVFGSDINKRAICIPNASPASKKKRSKDWQPHRSDPRASIHENPHAYITRTACEHNCAPTREHTGEYRRLADCLHTLLSRRSMYDHRRFTSI